MQINNCARIIAVVLTALNLLNTLATAREMAGEKPTRVALVIGNSRYEAAVGPLRNTVNDAKAMAATLRALGFSVTEEHNVTRDELLAAIMRFRARLHGAEVGLFYFAGHGIAVSGSNYLLPVHSGYQPEAADDAARRLLAETKLFNAEQAIAAMSNTGVPCNLVILDACRNTPVARNPVLRNAAKSGGLVEMNPPAGSLIAFSTDAGRAALDGAGSNGLYTGELIVHLRTPGLTIEQVFKRTRAGVIERSGGTQIPAEYSRLVGEDIFLAGSDPAVPSGKIIPKGVPVAPPTLAHIGELAASGDAARCTEAMRRYARKNGAGNFSAAPLAALLERVKDDLREARTAAPHADALLQSCDLILAAIAECLPAEHAQYPPFMAKAQNRRGDALLLLRRNDEALDAFDAALVLMPADAYMLYNHGRAQLALQHKDEARADFSKAIGASTKHSAAHKLATAALAAME